MDVTEELLMSWIPRHEVGKPAKCQEHTNPNTPEKAPKFQRKDGEDNTCSIPYHECRRPKRGASEDEYSYCRRRTGHFGHFFPPRMGEISDMVAKFRVWIMFSQKCPPWTIALQCKLHVMTVYRYIDEIEKVFFEYSKCHLPKFAKMQVDETYIGKRKYYRGHRSRKVKLWMFSATEYRDVGEGQQKTGRIYWEWAENRGEESCLQFVQKLILSNRTVVVTDSWRGYNRLGEICRHFRVNHAEEYVSIDQNVAVHTNNAESGHRTVKRDVYSQMGTFGRHITDVVHRCSYFTQMALIKGSGRLQEMMKVLEWGNANWKSDWDDGEEKRKSRKKKPVMQQEESEEEEGEEGEDDDDEEEDGSEDEGEQSDDPFVRRKARAEVEHMRLIKKLKNKFHDMQGWVVRGEMGNCYTVRIGHTQNNCTCPDYLTAKELGCPCKHIMFVLISLNVTDSERLRRGLLE